MSHGILGLWWRLDSPILVLRNLPKNGLNWFLSILPYFGRFLIIYSMLLNIKLSKIWKNGKINLLNFLLKPLVKKYNRKTEFSFNNDPSLQNLPGSLAGVVIIFFFVLQEWLVFFCESPCLIQTFSRTFSNFQIGKKLCV